MMESTEQSVIQWANQHGLIQLSKAQSLKQWGKTEEEIEEFWEIYEWLETDSEIGSICDTEAIYDAHEDLRLEAGDILVTLAIQLAIHRIDNGLTLIMASPMKPLGTLGDIKQDISSRLESYAPLTPNIEIHCSRLVGWLKEAIAPYGLSLEECFDAAYKKIKDRKGETVDGVFVKEAIAY